tara:strand:+ start:429 stop:695 length:267 start_codon:yes stop_codon:yes gene_type:complete
MGKTKNLLEGLDDALERADDAYQYEQWRNSKEYVDMANEEFALHKPKHSDAQIDIAISEAFKSLQVTSEEVGIDVYEKLFRQHFYENL